MSMLSGLEIKRRIEEGVVPPGNTCIEYQGAEDTPKNLLTTQRVISASKETPFKEGEMLLYSGFPVNKVFHLPEGSVAGESEYNIYLVHQENVVAIAEQQEINSPVNPEESQPS